jgi:SAM-dependent methyltransferase
MMRCQDGDNYDTSGLPKDPKAHPYIAYMDKFLPDKNIKILDIGAGDGAEVRMFMDYGYKDVTGITVGRYNCSRAKELHNVDLKFMDMHFTTFPNKTFDAVIGFQVFEHTPAPLLLGLEINRLLKPGGKVLLETPVGEVHFPYDYNPHHLYVIEKWQGKNMLRKCGFTNVKVEARPKDGKEARYIFYGEKVGDGAHVNHFNDIVNGKFLKEEN